MKAQSPSSQRRVAILAAFYAAMFCLTLWAAYTDNLPTHLLETIPYYDKIGHLVLYFIPSYLGHRVLKNRHFTPLGLRLPIFPTLFGLFTVTEELIQGFSPYRTLDMADLICGFVGIVVGYGLAQRSQRGIEDTVSNRIS
ncbi:MAG: VanZ family protein [Cyanobacteria bacterium P01_G01_bin.38]